MTNIIFLGFGNVGFHLANALSNISDVSVIQIYNRNETENTSAFSHIPFTTNLSEIKKADIYIIAIPDDAIASFSDSLPFTNQLLVHTSGSVSMDALSDRNRKGVFYPLQTFSKNRKVKFKKIPVCIEASNTSDLKLLMKLGLSLSKNVVEVNSEERSKLHLAAVFVNNFVNHMYAIGGEILQDNHLSLNLLKPLITETASKVKRLTPSEAQTGPAKRNDLKTLEKHLHLLKDSPYKELYRQLTDSIVEKYNT